MRIRIVTLGILLIFVLLILNSNQVAIGEEIQKVIPYETALEKGLEAIKNIQSLTLKLVHPTRYDMMYLRFKKNESALAIFRYSPDGKLLKKSRYKMSSFEEWMGVYEKTHFVIAEIE